MKIFFFNFLASLLVLSSSCSKTKYVQTTQILPTAGTGNEGGNGGDSITSLNRGAWFLNEYSVHTAQGEVPKYVDHRAIRVCLVMAKDFGYDLKEAQEVVEFAFLEWRKYLNSQDIFLEVASRKYRPSTTLEWVQCESRPDLKIYLGEETRETKANRRRFLNPLAYVWQTKVDTDSGWGAGYIWLAPAKRVRPELEFPLWKQSTEGQFKEQVEAQFRQVLLHEVGHILGCDHVPGTIMRADIQDYLLRDLEGTRYRETFLRGLVKGDLVSSEIEQERLLMFSQSTSSHFFNSDHRVFAETLRGDGHVFETTVSTLPFDVDTQVFLFGYHANQHELGFSEDIKVKTTFWTQPGGKRFYLLSYLPRKSYSLKTVRLQMFLNVAPLQTKETIQVFKMRMGHSVSSYKGDGAEFYNGQIYIRGKLYNALVHRDLDNSPTSIIWVIVNGNRLRIN